MRDGTAAADPFAGTRSYFETMWSACDGDPGIAVRFADSDELPAVFRVTDFAAAAVGTAGAALAAFVRTAFGARPEVTVSRRLASLWYGWSIRPQGWELPPAWDAVAGDYAASDGWIRLHTNAPHHREAALAVLRVPADRGRVVEAVARWQCDALESAIVAHGGCAATMRSMSDWATHPQGQAVAAEPLLAVRSTGDADGVQWRPVDPRRPLAGLRVLDLTRVLAGPTATRFLAGYGADVLRLDPPGWDEPVLEPDMTLGKRCARLDLRDRAWRLRFADLLSKAHVVVHGYRADALEKLGLGDASRRAMRPGLVDVCLDAYGWSGPWSARRGFDSLVQMSSGIAEAGMRIAGKDRPFPLPLQALDHATGYLMAAAVLRGLERCLATGRGYQAKASLARTAAALVAGGTRALGGEIAPAADTDYSTRIEPTSNGPALRLRPPLRVGDIDMRWDRPATKLGSSPAEW